MLEQATPGRAMDSVSSTVMTSLGATTMTSSGLSTPKTIRLDHDDVGSSYTELQPQIRILRHYRASSMSPPSNKRRAAAAASLQSNGTRRRHSPSTNCGTTSDRKVIVAADCTTPTVHGVRSLPATPLAPSRARVTTPRNDAATSSVMFTTHSTTTTTTASGTSSALLVVTQTSNNARTSYSTFDCSHGEVTLPLDGVQQFGRSAGSAKAGKSCGGGGAGKSSSVDVEAPASAAAGSRRWRVRREAVVGTPSQTTAQNAQQRFSRARRCLGCLKSFVAFLFSTIGLTILLVGYTILGGIIFQALESSSSSSPPPPPSLSSFIELSNKVVQRLTATEHVNSSVTTTATSDNSTNDTSISRSASSLNESPLSITTRLNLTEVRNLHIELLWNMTQSLNVLHPDVWEQLAQAILDNYTQEVYDAKIYFDIHADIHEKKPEWKFGEALLYSITVITTIGYGNIVPQTVEGIVATMLYAVVGIPLTLLTITNLGGFMATVFRWFYKNVISGVCCCTHCDAPSSEAKRRKVAAAAAVAAVQATKTVKTVGRKVARSYASWPPTAEETVANAATDTFSSQASNHSSSSRESSVSTVHWRTGLRRTLHTGDYSSVHVPIYISLLLMLLYIALGAMLFSLVEEWDYLVGFYFCFITLSTIGFGDYVPGTSLRADSQGRMVLCALYLLVGLALLAMCFDLMQEEVRRKFRVLGTKIGLFEHQ